MNAIFPVNITAVALCDSEYGYAFCEATAYTAMPSGSRIFYGKVRHDGSGHSGCVIKAALPCCLVCG